MVKRLLLLTIILLLSQITVGFSQITIGTIDQGPYTPGSSIAATFNIDPTIPSCISQNNVFSLHLVHPDDTDEVIGSYTSFYSTFLNGTIPTGTPAGSGYKLRISSSAPAQTTLLSNAFDISPGTTPVIASLDADAQDKISTNPLTFGNCGTDPNLPLTEFYFTNNSSTGNVTVQFIDELNHSTTSSLTFNSIGDLRNFTASLAHYTMIVRAEAADGTIGTHAYFLVNNLAVTAFSTASGNTVCYPTGAFEYTVGVSKIDGIGLNFPGNTYIIDWGDGTSSEYTYCQIVNDGSKVRHNYNGSSCGLSYTSGIQTHYNAFGVNVNVESPFCGPVGAPLSTPARVVERPENEFTFSPVACVGEELTFNNISTPGQRPNTTSLNCVDNSMRYTWYVNDVQVAVGYTINQAFTYTFTSKGKYRIKLTSTGSGTCPADEQVHEICIQDRPVPKFTLPSNLICLTPGILTPTDDSDVDNTCQVPPVYTWTVTPSTGVTYGGGTTANSVEPQFQFSQIGIYDITLSIRTGSCAEVSTAKRVVVNSLPQATLSGPAQLCRIGNFVFDPDATDTKTNISGNAEDLPNTYTWEVTGGAYSFVGTSTANSKYPTINFEEYTIYTIKLTYQNNCNTMTRTQALSFFESPVPTIVASPNPICYDADINLQGSITNRTPQVTYLWIGNGGTFSYPDPNDHLKAIYTPTTAERDAGTAHIRLQVNTGLAIPCAQVEEFIDVAITPENKTTNPPSSLTARICTEETVTFTPTSVVSGSNFTWIATNADGNAAGFSFTGNGVINQTITNTSATQNAVVVYTITPATAACIGVSFTFTVTVTPKPLIDHIADKTICHNNSTAIELISNIPTQFTWTSAPSSSTDITGNTNGTGTTSLVGGKHSFTLNETLLNNSLLSETVTYTIKSFSAEDCEGTETTVIVKVDPAVTVANAGQDEPICETDKYQLQGNEAEVGTGKWEIVSASMGTPQIANETDHESMVTGLETGGVYIFKWVISPAGACDGTEATVTITVTPKPIVTTPELAKTICHGTETGIVLTSQIPTQFTWTSTTSANITGNNGGSGSTSLINGENSFTINEALQNNSFFPETVTYTIQSSSADGCEGNITTVTVTVDPEVTVAYAGPNDRFCDTDTYKLQGNKANVGTGKWELVAASLGSPEITDDTNFESTVTGLQANGVYTFKWVISPAGKCDGTEATVTITVTPRPTVTTPELAKTICHGTATGIVLTSDIPTRFTWTSSTSADITGNTGGTGSTSLIGTTNSFTINEALQNNSFLPKIVTYTIKSFSVDGCEGTETIVEVTIDPAVTIADAGQSENICNTNQYNLKGNEAKVGTGEWSLVTPHAVTPHIAVPTDFETTVTGLVAGEIYSFKWTITGTGQCPGTEATVTITVNVPTQPGVTAGAQTVCQNSNSGIVTLSGNNGIVLGWQSSTDNGATWQDIPGVNTGLTYIYTNLSTTTQLRAIVQNPGCLLDYSTATTITIAPATTIAKAGDAQILCNETEVFLKGNAMKPGETGLWTMVSGDPNAIITQGINSEATVTELTRGITYIFKWTINGNNPCSPSEDLVTIRNNNPIEQNTLTTSNAIVCNGKQITIVGQVPTGGEEGQYQYIWENQVNGGLWEVMTGETGKDLTITLITPGNTSFRRTVKSGNCRSFSNELPITIQPPIENNSIAGNQTICSELIPMLITGTLPTGGDDHFFYRWESSLNGTNWTSIAGIITPDYQPPALTQTTHYRRIVSTVECNGALESISITVTKTVTPNAKAEFTWGLKDTDCYPFTLPVQVVTYPDRNATYTWEIINVNGVIQTTTGPNFPGYTIENSGEWVTVKLVVTSNLNCAPDEMSHTFSTNQAVPASFNVSDDEICGPMPVNFTNTSLLTAGATFKWDFGNGQFSTAVHPSMIFDPDPSGEDIIYTVTLNAITDCGTSTVTKDILVKAKPKAVLTADKEEVCSPSKITFTNTSPGSTNTYYYDFGDGSTIFETTDKSPVSHIYNVTETTVFDVKLTVVNECGTDEKILKIRVFPQNIVPALGILLDEIQGCAPHTVHFENNSIGASKFIFDFGDGSPTRTTFASGIVTYTYLTSGNFTVTMTAYNSCSEIPVTKNVEVLPQPVADFAAENTLGCPGLIVKFKNNTLGGLTNSYVWDFGDGSPVSNEFEPEHTYTGDQEYYTVKLLATNEFGCPIEVIKTQFIHIVQPPVAAFNVNPSTLISIPDYTFKFEDESTNNPTIWEWDFGDGTGTSTQRNPSYTYLDTGTYRVTLKVTNQQGCFTTTFKDVTIKGVPGYLFVPNSFIPGSASPELRLFRAKGSGIKTWRFSIFNKWGQIIWETSLLDEGRPAEAWDGNFKGQPMPQGVYYWKIDVEMINESEWKGMTYDNTPPKRTGAIHLIR